MSSGRNETNPVVLIVGVVVTVGLCYLCWDFSGWALQHNAARMESRIEALEKRLDGLEKAKTMYDGRTNRSQ